jgi:hypothetical protein
MNKEQQELLDGAYENHLKGGHIKWLNQMEVNTPAGKMNIPIPYTQEEFIEKCKTDSEFSQKWGLKIEERELSLEERSIIAKSNHYEVSQNIKRFVRVDEDRTLHKNLDEINIPTKLITITYNDKTIESYES